MPYRRRYPYAGPPADPDADFAPAGYVLGFEENFTDFRASPDGNNFTWRTTHANGDRFRSLEQQVYSDATYKGLGLDPFEISGDPPTLKITVDALTAPQQAAIGNNPHTGLPPTWYSGILTSLTFFHQQYGYWVIRCRSDVGDGMWPAFWSFVDSPFTPYEEYDIFEMFGNEPENPVSALHFGPGPTIADATTYNARPRVDVTQWNLYSMLSTANGAEARVNGQIVQRRLVPQESPHYLLLNLAVRNANLTGVPKTFEIAWMRYYRTNSSYFESGYVESGYVEGLESAGSTLAFEDEFDTLSLDTALVGSANWAWKWVAFNAHSLDDNGDKAWKAWADYNPGGDAQSPAQMGVVLHEVSGGTLKLYGRVNPDPTNYFGFGFLGGMISTEMSLWQTYGVWECRARFFSSKGHHWAMWLIQKDATWPPEIDMVEMVNNGTSDTQNRAFMSFHGTDGSWSTYSNGITPDQWNVGGWLEFASTESWQDWHTYKFVWTPTTMEMWIDDLLRISRPNHINKPMYFIISPEIDGLWPGLTDGTTVWPMWAEIDYVRIYKTEPEPPLPDALFAENWTGSTGNLWPTARWNTAVETNASCAIDIVSNQGRLMAAGAAYAKTFITSKSGNIADFDLTAEFIVSAEGIEAYHLCIFRHDGSFLGNSNPDNAYWAEITQFGFTDSLNLVKTISGVRTGLGTAAKFWDRGLWYLRIQAIGTALKVKAWKGTEPGIWDIEVTDSSRSTGIISFETVNGEDIVARAVTWDNLTVVSA